MADHDDPGRVGSITVYDLEGAKLDHPRPRARTGARRGRVRSRPTIAPGGPGWLLAYVYDAATAASDMVVLDADDVAAGPVATVHLPARVPYGFHGSWLADL